MIQVYLIRHSMTAGNLKKRYIGRTDEPLCPEGIELLKDYIQKNVYPNPERVYVSPMKRCIETAELIFRGKHHISEFLEVDELKECDFGIFENKNYQELADCPEYQAWIDSGGTMTFPEGENPEEFRQRCVKGFEKILRECRKDHIKQVAIVVHGGTIMSIMDQYARDEHGKKDGSYYDYQVKNGEGYELIVADVSSGDGRICAGSDVRGSGMALSSGENDRTSDFMGGKNYKKLTS